MWLARVIVFLGQLATVFYEFLMLCILQEVAKQPNNNPEGWFELKINTHVYVTGLPTDVTSEEVSNY